MFTTGMQFDLGEDVNALRDMVHRWAQDRVRPLAARTDRETSLARLGMKRRYEDLRRLNDRVSAACNHRSGR